MNKPNIILIMLILFSISISFAQDLEKHRWKERVIIIFSDNKARIKNQVNSLRRDSIDLKERKLVIYSTYKNQIQESLRNDKWIRSEELNSYRKYKNRKIEVILIGLDGGVKLRQTEILTKEKLFTLIDGMPIRRSELRERKNKG